MNKIETNSNSEYLTTSMVAKILKIPEEQMRNLIYRGQLKRTKYLNVNCYQLSEVKNG